MTADDSQGLAILVLIVCLWGFVATLGEIIDWMLDQYDRYRASAQDFDEWERIWRKDV